MPRRRGKGAAGSVHVAAVAAFGLQAGEVFGRGLDIVAEHNGGDAEAAAEYLTGLQTEGRYGRDVY